VWESATNLCWFHYTRSGLAQTIYHEAVAIVSSEQHQGSGPGFYVTSLQPGAATEEELGKYLFALQRPPEAATGVVVLRRDPNLFPAKSYGRHKWVCDVGKGEGWAREGDTLDLTLILLGYGIRVGPDWLFSKGLHV
jgi:hypothetical protein